MSAKKKARSKSNMSGHNIVNMDTYIQKKQIQLLPRNKQQESYVLNLLNASTSIVFGIGPAGTGKTMLAVQAAVKKFKEKEIDRIIITRPAVSADEDLGFLPGTMEQKMAPWTRPVFDTLREYFSAYEIEGMIAEGIIEIAPLAYMRGRTFSKSFIIADEMQLATPNQMKMLLTRIGEGSQMAITGDLEQADRGKDNGLVDFLTKFENHVSTRVALVHFTINDVQRHPVVQEVLTVYGD